MNVIKLFTSLALCGVFASGFLYSSNAKADAGLGIQVFGESNDQNVTISGANLIVGSQSYGSNQGFGNHSFVYAGVGFKNIEGVSHEIDGNYPQIVIGFAMPWILSPYVEVGFDPFDYIVEEFDEHDDGVNSYLGVGARLSLGRRLSLDVGYKYHHFSNDNDNFYSNNHAHHYYYQDNGLGTAAVSLNVAF